jgi:hypothetical protein
MNARVAVWSLLAVGSLACVDYRLTGDKDDPPTGDSPPPLGDSDPPDSEPGGDDSDDPEHSDPPIDETDADCEDTGLHPDEPIWDLSELGEDTTGAPQTCTPLGEVDWDWTVEWSFPYGAFVMNVVVAPDHGDAHSTVVLEQSGDIIVLDGRDGSVLLETPIGSTMEDGNTPALADVDGSPGLELASTSWNEIHLVDIGTGSATAFPMSVASKSDEALAFADIDGDGEQEIAIPGAVYELDGTLVCEPTDGLESTGFFVSDLDGDGTPELVNTAGIWSAQDGSGVGWPLSIDPGYTFYGGPTEIGGAAHVLFTNGRGEVHLGAADGSVVWSNPDMSARSISAMGDATGDGVADICGTTANYELVLVGADGTTHWIWTGGPRFLSGGCSMADLDADGIYEVLAGGYDGLYVLDGASMNVLASEPSYTTSARDSAPVVADVDADGSAEILWLADGTLMVLGAATGRWARTRPVWHQLPYDITSIRDDGTLVSHPVPSWSSYNAFRAQPAHDGEHPDLHIEVEASAHEWCGENFTTLDLVVINRGSVEVPSGTSLTVSGLVEDAWIPVDTVEIDEPIPAGFSVAGSVALPSEALGSRWIVDLGTEDDCNWINNRAEGAVPSP